MPSVNGKFVVEKGELNIVNEGTIPVILNEECDLLGCSGVDKGAYVEVF